MNDINLKRFLDKEISFQEVADYAVGKILEQGCASVNSVNQCQYRGEGGTKCAIGHLIPDSDYLPLLDSSCGVRASRVIEQLYKGDKISTRAVFLDQLQKTHDRANVGNFGENTFIELFRKKAHQFYDDYNLIWSFGHV
jgi:hypothetical protein